MLELREVRESTPLSPDGPFPQFAQFPLEDQTRGALDGQIDQEAKR